MALLDGQTPMQRITAGTTLTARVGAVQAMNGDVTFGPATACQDGDAPADGDVLRQGEVLMLRFTAVENKAGSAGVLYAYLN